MKNIFLLLFLLVSSGDLLGQQLRPGILIPTNNISSIHENAIEFYSGIVERNPSDVKSILLRSELYKSLNMTDEANADIDLALSINPYSYLYLNKSERSKFFTRRNYSYLNVNDLKPSVNFKKSYMLASEYERLLSGDIIPQKTRTLFELALIAINEGDIEVAEHLLSTIGFINSECALYHDIKGVLYLERGKIENAIESFSIAIEKDPLFTIAYHNRAVAYKMINEYEAAENDFNVALKQKVNLSKVNFGKAKLLELMGDEGGAKYYYENAISTQDDYPEARLNYSVLLKAAGEYTRALIEINKLITEYPEDINNYYVRGGLYFIYGEYSKAVKDFDTYLTSNPKDLNVIFYKGLCLVMDGNATRGCQEISLSIDRDSNNYDEIYLFMCEYR